jgi:23S rRNA G2445 N2-methylase RlmL
MSWRLTVDGDKALLALRIGSHPLHRRTYRQITRPGSLHPPLAAALVRLAQPATGMRLLDPCCGAGTIPIEAAATARQLSIIGSDQNTTAIKTAKANGAGTSIDWLTADAGQLPLPTNSVDLVITNPPWDRQVSATGLLARHPNRFWHELRRVLTPNGRAVVLLTDTDNHLLAAEKAGLTPHHRRPISLSGTHPEITILSSPS